MRTAALDFARREGWSEKVGLFVHPFPHCSVLSLHVHIVDLDEACVGPTFAFLRGARPRNSTRHIDIHVIELKRNNRPN